MQDKRKTSTMFSFPCLESDPELVCPDDTNKFKLFIIRLPLAWLFSFRIHEKGYVKFLVEKYQKTVL